MTTLLLIIHRDCDTSVLIDEANNSHQWYPKSELAIIKRRQHIFKVKHLWLENNLPNKLKEAVDAVVKFIK